MWLEVCGVWSRMRLALAADPILQPTIPPPPQPAPASSPAHLRTVLGQRDDLVAELQDVGDIVHRHLCTHADNGRLLEPALHLLLEELGEVDARGLLPRPHQLDCIRRGGVTGGRERGEGKVRRELTSQPALPPHARTPAQRLGRSSRQAGGCVGSLVLA